ncbi:MAG: cyclohexanecarboxylate-CoA ligase [Kaistia sp. SCN 65-12]|uniref:class I adenylate-forming enzyme family protein n=1 Tax=Hyphomicrobium sp. CS1BSMeth3 TaxID=1892844 RepID=UPI00086AEC87|nr:class I adenylate-forming enzyme family protein [Hyphomicrobium sp. CS1BSMeth3]ODT22618.1 MAG: cyclohexanecarboxylate-CoA ligase [Kaistia sp. SCN 65-12]
MRPFLTLHHPTQAQLYYEQGVWRAETFYGLLARHSEERPEAIALQDGRRKLTWKELREWVDGVAADLLARGIAGGDRVAIWMSNRVEPVVMFLACAREGLACNPSLHRTFTCAEIGQLLERLRARALLTEPTWGADRAHADFDAVLAGVPSLKAVYAEGSLPGPAVNLGAAVADPDRVVYLAFTSGTTGSPKCVMHSHNTLLANARDMVRDWGHGPDTVLLSLSPLSHHIAWVGIAQWLVAGCRFVTNDPPHGVSTLDWIIRTGATYVMGVPTHAMDVLAQQKATGLERLGRVSVFYMAGAPIPPSVAAAFVAQGIKPQNIYGMTECSSHQYTHPDDETEICISTCGRGGAAYEVCLFDPADRDRPLGPSETGEIGGRGGALMLGYFDNQTATEDSFNRDGWFMSGDLGSLDEHGNLKVEGRLKDLIIRGGHNIYPAHIEALALRHADVERVACFPVTDERLGERVCIAVTGNIASGELLGHLEREGLSRYDMPEYFTRLDEFPLTASGKILKRELIEMVKRGAIAPVLVRFEAK